MTQFLLAWWPLFVLIQLPWIASKVAHTLYMRAKSRLDHATPDTLPETAGQWLERKVAVLGLGVRSIVTDDRAKFSRNAYHIDELKIQLTEDVYFKRDPAFWAIAAHELGHARFRIGQPRLARMIFWLARVEAMLVSLGLALGLGNMLYGLPHVTNVAFVLLAVALGLHVVTIVEEMIASAFAFDALKREAHLTPAHLRNVRVVLFLALMTYLASFAGHAMLLAAWSIVESNTTQVPVVVSTLTTFGAVLVVVWSVIAAMSGVSQLLDLASWSRWPTVRFAFILADAASIVALPSLLWLLWDVRAEPAYAWCVMLAAVAAIRMITGGAALVFSIPFLFVRRFFRDAFRGIEGIGIERSDVFLADVKAGAGLTKAGNAEIERIIKRNSGRSSWVFRLSRVLVLPLLALYWLL